MNLKSHREVRNRHVKALSQKRRHPFAGVALLLLGLLITGGLYTAATTINEAQASESADAYSDPENIEVGERLFVANCATCHGINARAPTPDPR